MLTDPRVIQRDAYGGQHVVVSASSAYTEDPPDQAYAAFDGNPRTAWISGAADARPRLTIAWRGARLLSGITVLRPAGATELLQVQITGSAGQLRTVILGQPDGSGRDAVRFAPMITSSLTLTFPADDGYGPVQITDVQIPGVRQLVAHPAAPLRLGCGSGPAIRVNGRPVATRASGTVADILDSRPLTFTACRAAAMAAGRNVVTEQSTDAFSVQGLALIRDTAGAGIGSAAPVAALAARGVRVLAWTSARRVVAVTVDQSAYLIVSENFNAGWQASLGGRDLQPVRLDGWKQGWLLPSGARGLVTLTYRPDSEYRMALFAGLAALFLLIAVAVLPLRRRPVSVGRLPGEPGSSRRAAGVRACGMCLTVLVGLWAGGYPGAGVLPVLTLGFLTAIGCRESSRVARAAADPWVMAALMVIAACCDVAGNTLWAHGAGGALMTALAGVIPELCCLAVAGRLAAALLTAGPPGAAARTPTR